MMSSCCAGESEGLKVEENLKLIKVDGEDVKLALARKKGQARGTWKEIGTVLNLACAQVIGSTRAGTSPADASVNGDQNGHNNDETDLPMGTRWMVLAHALRKAKRDLMAAVLIVYSTLIVPFRTGFDQTSSALETAMDAVVDVVFAADNAASLRTILVDEVNARFTESLRLDPSITVPLSRGTASLGASMRPGREVR